MPFQPGQSGNPEGSKKVRRWQGALERALARFADGSVDDGLNQVADTVVRAAVAGDRYAWAEIGDRVDGKVPQEHSGPDGGAIILHLNEADSRL